MKAPTPRRRRLPGESTPGAPATPGLPVFTLCLGATAGLRPPAPEVAAIVGTVAPSFSLTPCEGVFRGVSDPGWAVTLALNDHAAVAGLAEALRERFRQEGVGIEAYGRYLRCHAGKRTDELIADMDTLARGSITDNVALPPAVAAAPPRPNHRL